MHLTLFRQRMGKKKTGFCLSLAVCRDVMTG